MESRPVTFLRDLQTWPSSEIELSAAADRVREFLRTSHAAIWVEELGLRQSVRDADLDDPSLQAWIRTQFEKAMDSESRSCRMIPASGQSPDLLICPILMSVPGDGPGSERVETVAGWLGTVLSRESNREVLEQELGFAAWRLAELAERSALRSVIAQRDQFLSIASHELKTPLTSIYGILQLQERMLRPPPGTKQTPEQERQHSFFKIVIRQVERLNELIDALLDVSRICNGRFNIERSETDVAALARETVNSRLSVIAREASVRIEADFPEKLVADVDPIRFEEVVTNLGMNAIRFSPEGGTVWIRLSGDENSITLSFRDQGPAVPEQDRSRIFQPFERAQRTTRLGGLGLGLFISRQIAQLHGGDVRLAESVFGRGNVFEARFPIREQQRSIA